MRGKGVGATAARQLTGFGFESMGFERIEARVDVENEHSKRLLLSVGYTLEGILRKVSCRADGPQVDMALYSIIRSDWQGI